MRIAAGSLLLLLLINYSLANLNGQLQSDSTENVHKQRQKRAATTTYHEQFETFDETMKRQKQLAEEGRKQPGDKPTMASRTRYMEFAETEFSRPSVYLPMPFMTASNNRIQVIPARTLSQLIRQHIARNRMKQLTQQNSSYLRGSQSRMKELRQTPFRRWPTNSSTLSYAEKRRQWKMELKRRLHGEKVPTRIIPPLLISGGGHSSIQTDREPENRYYVTYSPQTRVYQVSRRPPPYLYTTDQDLLPQQLEGEMPSRVSAESDQEEGDVRMDEHTTHVMTTTLETATTTVEEEEEETARTTTEPPTEAITTMEQPTTSPPPTVLVVLQKAEPVPDSSRTSESHQQFVTAVKKGPVEMGPIKQILFMEDYEQVQGEEEAELEDATTTTQSPVPRAKPHIAVATTARVPIPPLSPDRYSLEERKRAELGRVREKLQQSLLTEREEAKQQEEKEDEFIEEENEDEDLFFFKPVGEQQRHAHAHQQKEADPFRIVVHEAAKRKWRR